MSTVIVVGAGLAGLMAGRELVKAGHEVLLLDKGRSPGGRLATRRIGQATLDHGAQFFTVRSPVFGAYVERVEDLGPALDAAFASGKPACVNVRIARSDFRKGAISV